MKEEYQHALAKGLPFPILTVAEYLSQDGEGFCWGRKYRAAGYYASLLLWAAFATWLLMNILLCAVPRYGLYFMQITGAMMLSANAIYAVLLPRKPLAIPFEGETLTFAYGWCFWALLIAGCIAVVVGAAVTIVDTLFPNKFSTILEVDYDTPYRYFVGNDAHLFGQANMDKSNHLVASATSSTATSTTTCDKGTNSSSSVLKPSLTKTKSDASTLTNTSIPVTRDAGSDGTVTSTTPSIHEADIEVDLEILQSTDDRKFQKMVNSHGVTNKGFIEEEDQEDVRSEAGSDVSTTIIDGKRAISLHNFGRFAAKQQLKQRGSISGGGNQR